MMLLTYTVTEQLMDAFTVALRMQQSFFPEAISGCELAVFTDRRFDKRTLPFSDHITVHVFDDLWKGSDFWMARSQNHALAYAASGSSDWVGLLSADCFVMELPRVNELPKSGFSAWRVWLQGNEAGRVLPLEETLVRHSHEHMWHLVHRRAFTDPRCRLDEDYFGYGSEDVDFSSRVLPGLGFNQGVSCGKLFHVWHPRRDLSRSEINEALFHSKKP